ncbi:MAG: tRNA (guanosine(37)-N1)-methyltransferase TrmD [Myxococcales bacterium]|nr:MAG: tRNA (guanosine(37)-N1)-methyltransferase TrmD [Myxococcales bacterium]
MDIAIVTLFPELFDSYLRAALLGKALEQQRFSLQCINPRSFTQDKHQSVDDLPYGGGSGMVMKAEPLVKAMESFESDGKRSHRIMLSASGKVFKQGDAQRLSEKERLTFLCGRYEGIDDRVSHFVDEELSLGDFVLMGGEAAAMAMIESTVRLLPGVIGNPESLLHESHAQSQLEYPQYTRPPEFRGYPVPEVLLSGDHGAIERYRQEQSLIRTRSRRPELIEQQGQSTVDKKKP